MYYLRPSLRFCSFVSVHVVCAFVVSLNLDALFSSKRHIQENNEEWGTIVGLGVWLNIDHHNNNNHRRRRVVLVGGGGHTTP